MDKEYTEKHQYKPGIILQILTLVTLGLLIIGVITYFSQYRIADADTKEVAEEFASRVADELKESVQEYPAYPWLLRYWYEHSEDMDIEYDVEYQTGTRTEEKQRLLSSRHPDFQIRYADESDVLALPEEDQKLYAEIAYSWLVTRVNQIKKSYDISYLYCVLTDDDSGENPYGAQFFLLSAAVPGSVRGREYNEVYTLGTIVDISDNTELQESMRTVARTSQSDNPYNHFEYSGHYADYYKYMDSFDGHVVFIGVSDRISDLLADIYKEALYGTAVAMFYQIILILLIILLLYKYALHPMKTVLKEIREYTENKDSQTVIRNLEETLTNREKYLLSHNEIGQLSDNFVTLTKEIDDYIANIEKFTAENERMNTELGLAARLQAAMLPSNFPAFPDHNEFDLFALMDPAREVGGDFYDFFLIDEDHLALVIADVSGKGIPAALFMMACKIVLKNTSMMGLSPSEILTRANGAICANNKEDMFITVWIGILEISTGKLTCSNAGHEYPVLKKPGEKYELYKDKHGFVIGGMHGIKFTSYDLQLTPGTKIFVYTDGVPEATDKDNQLFGTDRLLDALNTNPDQNPEETITTVVQAIAEFVGDAEQFDDVTMLAFEYKGKA